MSGTKILKLVPAPEGHRDREILRRIKALEDQMILVRAQARLDARRAALGLGRR